MADLTQENAQLEQEIAAIEAQLTASQTPSYNAKQLGFDLLAAAAKATVGTSDILAYPFVKALQYGGADVETFGGTKLLNALIESNQVLPGLGAAEILGVRPTTEAQKAFEFMYPTLAGKKATLLKEAGLGLTGYLGSKLGESATESPYGSIAGAVLAPLSLQTALSTGKNLYQAAKPSVQTLLGNEEALKNIAQQEVLANLGPAGIERLAVAQAMPELLTGTGGIPLTAAEIAQTPSMAAYQQGLRQLPGADNVLQDAVDARKSKLAEALDVIAPVAPAGELSTLLRGSAEQAANLKQAQEKAILENIGLTPDILEQTRTERGASFLEGLQKKEKDAKEVATESFERIPGQTQIDAAYALTQAERDFNSFNRLDKVDVSNIGKEVINEVQTLLSKNDGRVTIDELKSLRSAAGRALKEASGKNPREVKLMRGLQEDLDLIGVEQILTKDANAPQTAIEKWKQAIKERRDFGQKFEKGVTGELLEVRKLENVTKASDAINKILKKPENVSDILGKFGQQSDEAFLLRSEMLSRLAKQSNPAKFVEDYKDQFKLIFDEDYGAVVNYAQSKSQKAPLAEYANIAEKAIPNKVFASKETATQFAEQFKDSAILDYARGKFVNERILKGGNVIENLKSNKPIANALFKEDSSALERIINDYAVANSPEVLQKLAVGRNSITSIAQTAIGAIKNGRVMIQMLKTGKVTGPMAGTAGAIVGTMGGNYTAGLTSLFAGGVLGGWAEKLANARELQINRFAAELVSNPKFIKLASAPPTERNINALMELGAKLGYFGSRAANQSEANSTQNAPQDLTTENATLEQEVKSLENQYNQSRTTTIGKQNISIPTGEAYAPANLIKAVMQVESSGKQEAESPKGAKGLMQLMPRTARDLGVDRNDPQQNVEGGSRYLKQQIEAFGSIELALAAYNWGPANITNAIKKIEADGKKPTWALVKEYVKVPQETREYVDKVLSLV